MKPSARVRGSAHDIVIPLHSETIAVSKKKTATHRVRVQIVTREHAAPVDQLLTRELVEIERRPMCQLLDQVPAVREENNEIIIPVVEEILTIERGLILREEIRIRRKRTTERHQEDVTVRSQEAIVTRIPN